MPGLAAMAEIDTIVTAEAIDCGWAWVPGYKFAALDGDPAKEASAAAGGSGAGGRAWLRRALSRRGAVLRTARDRVRRPGAGFTRASTWRGSRRCIDGGGSHVFEHTESEEVVDDAAVGQGRRPHDLVRLRRHRDAHAADGQDQHRQRDALADQAVSLYLVRARRPRAEGNDSGRALLGHRDPVSLPAARSAIATTTT